MNPTIEPWVIGLMVFGLLTFMGILVAFSLTLTLRSRTELEEIKSRSVGGAPLWTKNYNDDNDESDHRPGSYVPRFALSVQRET